MMSTHRRHYRLDRKDTGHYRHGRRWWDDVKAQAAGSTVVTLATPAHGTQPGGAMCALRSTAATCHTLPAQPYQFKTGLQHKKNVSKQNWVPRIRVSNSA